MAAQKNVLGLIHAGREIRRPPLVGMQFLHQRAVGAADVLGARPRLHAKDLISLLFRHFAAAPRRAARPRCRITLHVLTPAGSRRSRYAISSARLSSSISARQAGQRRRRRARRGHCPRAAGEDAPAHRAGVVIELHLDEGRAHARHLARRSSACAAPKPGRAERQPAEQAQARECRAGPRCRTARARPGTPRRRARRCRPPIFTHRRRARGLTSREAAAAPTAPAPARRCRR